MDTRLIIVLLIGLTPLPDYISIFEFVKIGGLEWPMLWNNEKRFWGVVFISFSVLAVILAVKQKTKHPNFTLVTIPFAALVSVPALYQYLVFGVGPSSKADSEQLELLLFWFSFW